MNTHEAFRYNSSEYHSLPQEIERKFLLSELPLDIDQFPYKDIEQGYLSTPENTVEYRVRKIGDSYFCTIKTVGALIRDEQEQEIEENQFNSFWKNTEGRRVSKRRYTIEREDGYSIEVDVYKDRLEGLIIAEVEFSSKEEAEKFHVPEWFGKEVTNSQKYKNKNLALTQSLDELLIEDILDEEKKSTSY